MAEVKTGVDELMELVRTEGRISIPDAAKKLQQSERAVQNWVDFLVEERLLGIEYKFTTPYIYINAPQKAAVAAIDDYQTFEDVRKSFLKRAKEKSIPQDKLGGLWQNHLLAAIDAKSPFFQQECKKRGLAETETLFKRYKEKLMKELELPS